MERPSDPFPLAVNSSHHSHYHRFLLGAEGPIIAPLPKPYCIGRLVPELPGLADALDLQRWRKLYCGSVPWVSGFGPAHYRVGNVPPYRPLPPEYGRPARRFGAFDFVQIADPAVSALALVAGDARVLERFVRLNDRFLSWIEAGARVHRAQPGRSAATRRLLCGQFVEPNNRWLMPFLHVHSRVLNFTSFAEEPRRLYCLDHESLSGLVPRARQHWVEKQGQLLGELGYTVEVRGRTRPVLAVRGLPGGLLSALEAPRLAVLSLLERMVLGAHPAARGRLAAEIPTATIAVMVDRLGAVIARSLSFYRPPKIALPADGPWRQAVRDHLTCYCPGALAALDATAARAKASPCGRPGFPVPATDGAHRHAPDLEEWLAPAQGPTEPELGAERGAGPAPPAPLPWLARDFGDALQEVSERLVRAGPTDPFALQRETLVEIDQGGWSSDPAQLERSYALVDGELERRNGRERAAEMPARPPGVHHSLVSLDELFAHAAAPSRSAERDLGGRSR